MTLSKEALSWLKSVNDEAGDIPSPSVIEELKPFRPPKAVWLFRGLCFKNLQDFQEKTGLTNFPQQGSPLSLDLGVHWSFKESIACDFADGVGEYGLLLKAMVLPEEIIVDLDSLPQEIRAHLEWIGESEAVLIKSPALSVVAGVKTP